MIFEKSLITLKNVDYAVAFEGGMKKLLSDISFSLMNNTFTTVIGPNGAGKTTLIKIILGLFEPTKGVVERFDTNIGYVPQKLYSNSYMPITVKSYLSINNITEFNYPFDISNLLDNSMHSLSGGELQKVLLNVAVSNNPDLLILDEPTQGIDVNGLDIFYNTLLMLKAKNNLSILLVSHDLHFVFDYTDNVICLNKHVCCQGHPETVKNQKDMHSLFPGFVPYRHCHDHEH